MVFSNTNHDLAYVHQTGKPLDGFSKEEFQTRRKALHALHPSMIIIVRGNEDRGTSYPLPFRQNSSFFYLTGLDTPGCTLVLLPDGIAANTGARDLKTSTSEILFLPDRNPAEEAWTGVKLGPGEETEHITGIEKTMSVSSVWTALTGWLKQCPSVGLLAPYGEHSAISEDYELLQKVRSIAPIVSCADIAPALAVLRSIKSTAEIERMKQAVQVTMHAQRAAEAVIKSGAGRGEYEVEAAIQHAFHACNASPSFAPIVGSGIRSTVLHYENNHQLMQAGDSVVVDIGAYVGHYCGDITRTYPVGGSWSERHQEIYDLVRAAHHHVVNSFQLGVDTILSVAETCKSYYKDSPVRATGVDGIEQHMDAFLPHGICHHLGLDVHDIHKSVDWKAPLKPGAVVTIEPGLYLPDEAIGVRLENDYVVTEQGLQSLGEPV